MGGRSLWDCTSNKGGGSEGATQGENERRRKEKGINATIVDPKGKVELEPTVRQVSVTAAEHVG